MRTAPSALRWIAARLIPAAHRELVLDDLDEDFSRRVRRPHFWYLAQAAHIAWTRPWRPHHLVSHLEKQHLMLSTIWQDVRFAIRTLRKAPGFTAVAVISLAVGIGLNSTIFTIIDNVLLRPLPFERPDSLVALYTSDSRNQPYGSSSYLDLKDIERSSTAFDAVVGHAMMFAAISTGGENRLAFGEVVTANFFDVLGLPLSMGQGFQPAQHEAEGASPVVIISDRFWRRVYAGRSDIVGQTMKIKSRPYTIVGVAAPSFTGITPGVVAELWIPASMVEDVEPAGQIDVVPSATGTTRLTRRGNRWMFAKARLRDGASPAGAQANLDAIMTGLAAEHPVSNRDLGGTLIPASEVRLHPEIDAVMRPAGAVLMGAVGLVLLIACANLASMLLARGAARTREMALRAALGASRGRLVRQMTVESVVLSLAGGLVGLLVGYWGASLLATSRLPIDLPIEFTLTTDWRVVAFTGGLSLLTGLAFGVLPALKASRPDLVPALKDDATLAAPGRAFGLRHSLVVLQVAVSVVLLVGGLLLTRSLFAGLNMNPGFDVGGLVTATVSMDLHGYDATRSKLFFERAEQRIRALPAVQGVTLAERLPFSPNMHTTTLVIDGRPEATPANGASVDVSRVTNEYFHTLGVDILAGRGFDSRDTPESTQVAIVSEAFVKKYYPAGDALGHRIRLRDQAGPIVEIVGISRDYMVRTIGEPPRPMVHFAVSQRPTSSYSFLARTTGDPSALVTTIEREIKALEPEVVFLELGSLSRMAAATMLPVSLGAGMFGGLAGLAMMLAGVGLYGVVAYSVSRRTKEIGIRMALGSSRGLVVRRVLREALTLVAAGTVLGVALAVAGAQALSTVLLGVTAFDPVSYAGAAILLGAVAAVAAIVPARRAATVDPIVALRSL